jgi:DNA polymerase III alpha subunit (gram-positive type)
VKISSCTDFDNNKNIKKRKYNKTYHWYGKELNNIITKRITVTNKIIIIDNQITWLCTL